MSTPVLKKIYNEQIVPELMRELELRNRHEAPNLEKIIVSIGLNANDAKETGEDARKLIGLVTGQEPVFRKAKKSISNFNLREGMKIGVMVTLRGNMMWEFFYRLVNISLTNVRDFRGVSNKLNGRSYDLGISDISIFPEAHTSEPNKKQMGLNISIVTTAEDSDAGRLLLKSLGMPFRKTSSGQTQASKEN